ncbi:uncharacterized protein LOC122365756 [Amphibalanus amphitrite]|uniref:uncharacterized protein LOC122365756 n=1 Tax=Amphibalanus amphitrite TaxID=1232801 RepID=UPI001C927EC2|nr:uncharacterized protein LOC122365756 [Amphibalanus amphitrite]
MQAAQLRKPLHAVVWHRGPISGPLTPAVLSELLQRAAAAPQPGDLRCEVRCADGFSLRLCTSGDEGFESDEEAVSSGASEHSQEEIRVSDHVLRGKLSEEDSSSANSSCSDTDEPPAPPPADSSVIHGADILFCHTEPAVPRGVLFVARQPQAGRDAGLEVLVLGCARDSVAKDLSTSYLEVTRRLKWERYTNAKRKSDVMRASFRNVTDSLRLRPAGRQEDSLLSRMPLSSPLLAREPHSLTEQSGGRLPADGTLRAESGPHSLPPTSEISRILSLSTPEDGWETRTAHRQDDEETWARGRERSCLTPSRYVHNKGPAPAAPAPAPRKHPTNPNLLLVPTKNGLEPYRVITGAEPPRPPLVLYAAEFAPHAPPAARADWAHKMAQFDTNNNRSRQPGRQPIFWLPAPEPAGWGGGPRRAEQHLRPRSRSKSPAGRHRAFELPGALSQAFRGLTSHLKRPAAEAAAPPAAPATPTNPKSVMKKRDKAAGSPETKRVTFSAYSTVQVMD